MRIALAAAALLASAAVPAQAEPVSAVSVSYNIDVGPMTLSVVKDGGAIDYAPREKKAERRARIDNALNDEVADPMTAVLRIGTSGETPCPSVHQIFDGRDVFELALTDKGEGEMKGDGGYRGKVRNCEVSWTPIAGRAAEKNEPRESYDVSFAPIGELPSGRTLWLPVSLSGKLKGLRFTAYVTKLKSEGEAASTASTQN